MPWEVGPLAWGWQKMGQFFHSQHLNYQLALLISIFDIFWEKLENSKEHTNGGKGWWRGCQAKQLTIFSEAPCKSSTTPSAAQCSRWKELRKLRRSRTFWYPTPSSPKSEASLMHYPLLPYLLAEVEEEGAYIRRGWWEGWRKRRAVDWERLELVDCPTRWYWYLDFYVDHRYPDDPEI